MMTGEKNRYKFLSKFANPRARNIINDLWRKEAKMGYGSSMAAFRIDKSHLGKLINSANRIRTLLKDFYRGRESLTSNEINTLNAILLDDIFMALKGK